VYSLTVIMPMVIVVMAGLVVLAGSTMAVPGAGQDPPHHRLRVSRGE
jgi:hypothetical protein